MMKTRQHQEDFLEGFLGDTPDVTPGDQWQVIHQMQIIIEPQRFHSQLYDIATLHFVIESLFCFKHI